MAWPSRQPRRSGLPASRRAGATTARTSTTSSSAAAHGLYEIRGLGAKRQRAALRRPASSSAPRCRAIRSKAIASAATTQDRARHAVREEADRARDSDHDRRHELRLAVGQREGGARPRGDRDGHVDHDRRRRHDAGGAPVVEDAGLPVPAVALRLQSGRRAQGRRDRGRDRPGREARRRRHAARAEDQPARREDAHAARGRRPALGVPASGLDRPRRSRDQDPGTARDHRLGEADLREGRRDARVQRREAGGALGRRRGRRRRHAGRHRRHADGLHRARRHPHARRRAPGGRCARGAEHARARCSSSSPAASAAGPMSPRRWRMGADAVSIGQGDADRAGLQQR